MSTRSETSAWPWSRGVLAWTGVALGWTVPGLAYGLLVAVRMDLSQRLTDVFGLMAYVGFAFGLLGTTLWLLRAAVRAGLRLTSRTAPKQQEARGLPARFVAGLGAWVFSMALLYAISDAVVALAFQPESAGVGLLIRIGAALLLGGFGCWALAGPLSRRVDGLLVRLRDPRGIKTGGILLLGLLAPALLIPLLSSRPDREADLRRNVSERVEAVDTGLRVALIGLDGTTWTVMDPLVEQGRVPVMASLIEGGARATPLSPQPRASPITWSTIVTGHTPERHGISAYLLVSLPGLSPFPFESLAHDRSILPFSFVTMGYFLAGVADGIPPTSDRLRVKSIWHMLADGHKRSLVLGIPCTWPAEAVPGLMVSERFCPTEFDMFSHHTGPVPNRVYPAEAEGRLASHVVASHKDVGPMLRALGNFSPAQVAELTDWVRNPLVPPPAELLADVWDADGTFLNILQAEWPKGDYAFSAVLLNGLDLCMHAFWDQRFPADFGHKQASRPEWGELIDAYHALVDQGLGALLEASGPNTLVLLLSDSGMEASPTNPVWPGWHAEQALFVASGGPIRKGIRLDAVTYQDVVPTLLYLLGYPVPDDLPGRVLTEMIEPEFLQRFPVRRIASYE